MVILSVILRITPKRKNKIKIIAPFGFKRGFYCIQLFAEFCVKLLYLFDFNFALSLFLCNLPKNYCYFLYVDTCIFVYCGVIYII